MCPIILPYLKQALLEQRVISRHVNGQTGGYITACMMETLFWTRAQTCTHTHTLTELGVLALGERSCHCVIHQDLHPLYIGLKRNHC